MRIQETVWLSESALVTDFCLQPHIIPFKNIFYFAVKMVILYTTILRKSSQTLVLMQTSKFWLRFENSLHASSRNTFAVLSSHI